jgi:NADPH2:quinone reductase
LVTWVVRLCNANNRPGFDECAYRGEIATFLTARICRSQVVEFATSSPEKHETVRELGADHVLDSRSADIAGEVLRLTGGTGADLVLESVGGATFGASLSAARRVTGRVIVSGLPAGEATLTNWDLVYKHQVHIICLNMGALIQFAPQLFGEVMGELFGLIRAGVLTPSQPTIYELADGSKALVALESRASIGKLALRP